MFKFFEKWQEGSFSASWWCISGYVTGCRFWCEESNDKPGKWGWGNVSRSILRVRLNPQGFNLVWYSIGCFQWHNGHTCRPNKVNSKDRRKKRVCGFYSGTFLFSLHGYTKSSMDPFYVGCAIFLAQKGEILDWPRYLRTPKRLECSSSKPNSCYWAQVDSRGWATQAIIATTVSLRRSMWTARECVFRPGI